MFFKTALDPQKNLLCIKSRSYLKRRQSPTKRVINIRLAQALKKSWLRRWPKLDIIAALNVFSSLDGHSFHLVNDALLVLLRKKSDADSIKDYRPISLMHSFGKMITKCLVSGLTPFLGSLVMPNQTASSEDATYKIISERCNYHAG